MVGDPQVPVIWLSNTGRSRGTMLCQVFESVPGTLAIMEPDPSTNVLYEFKVLLYTTYEGFSAFMNATTVFHCI